MIFHTRDLFLIIHESLTYFTDLLNHFPIPKCVYYLSIQFKPCQVLFHLLLYFSCTIILISSLDYLLFIRNIKLFCQVSKKIIGGRVLYHILPFCTKIRYSFLFMSSLCPLGKLKSFHLVGSTPFFSASL